MNAQQACELCEKVHAKEFRDVHLTPRHKAMLGLRRLEVRDPEFRMTNADGSVETGTLRFDTKLNLRNPFSIVWTIQHALRDKGVEK